MTDEERVTTFQEDRDAARRIQQDLTERYLGFAWPPREPSVLVAPLGRQRFNQQAGQWEAAGPRFCLHPNQVTEYHVGRGGWRRTRVGSGWRLARSAGRGVYGVSCPDCPARMHQLDMGGAFEGRLAPWLLG